MVQMFSRDIENMRSFLPVQLSSIGSLEEDAQAWNRVSSCMDFEKQQDCVLEVTCAVDEAGSPRAEYRCPECFKAFLSSRARATHESRVHGTRRPALAYARDRKCPCCSCDFHSRVRLVHFFSYSSKNVCSSVSLQCLRKSNSRWMLRTRLFEINASWKVVAFSLLWLQLSGARRKQGSVEALSGVQCISVRTPF